MAALFPCGSCVYYASDLCAVKIGNGGDIERVYLILTIEAVFDKFVD